MQLVQPRLTVFRLILLVAVAAISCYVVTDKIKKRATDRRERFLEIADREARIGADYRANANAGFPDAHEIVSWHEFMREEYVKAAEQGVSPSLPTSPMPPKGWKPPTRPALVP